MQFEQAMSLFQQACEVVSDNASKVFIMRCKHYLNNEPKAEKWNGVWDLTDAAMQRRFSRIIKVGYRNKKKRKLQKGLHLNGLENSVLAEEQEEDEEENSDRDDDDDELS